MEDTLAVSRREPRHRTTSSRSSLSHPPHQHPQKPNEHDEQDAQGHYAAHGSSLRSQWSYASHFRQSRHARYSSTRFASSPPSTRTIVCPSCRLTHAHTGRAKSIELVGESGIVIQLPLSDQSGRFAGLGEIRPWAMNSPRDPVILHEQETFLVGRSRGGRASLDAQRCGVSSPFTEQIIRMNRENRRARGGTAKTSDIKRCHCRRVQATRRRKTTCEIRRKRRRTGYGDENLALPRRGK
jgi:hypothetical protein